LFIALFAKNLLVFSSAVVIGAQTGFSFPVRAQSTTSVSFPDAIESFIHHPIETYP